MSGCDGDVTRNIRHAGFNIDGEFKCDVVMPSDKKDTSYANIRYMTDGLMILEDGTIYELSLGQKYANKQNCKIADTSKRVVSIFDDKYFKSNDDKYYYLSTNEGTATYTEVPKTDNSYPLIDLILKDATNVKVVTGNNSSGEYYALKNSGDIYKYRYLYEVIPSGAIAALSIIQSLITTWGYKESIADESKYYMIPITTGIGLVISVISMAL